MKFAVTGAFGFVGSNLVKRLVQAGHEVLALEHPSAKKPANYPECKVAFCDITDMQSMLTAQAQNYDALLHLAAQSSGPRSFDIPDVDVKINVLGTVNSIRWCKENKIPKLVFASSFVVYGDNENSEICKETDLMNPKSVYAVSKLSCEQLMKVYAEPLGIKWNALRMFNVYGPGQDITRTDQGLVAIFLGNVLRSDYIGVKGSLERFRDLVYIDDVVQAWELAAMDKNHPNQIYNVGSGEKTTFKRLIYTLIEVCGKAGKVKVEEVGSTQGDIMGCYADISKIARELNYKPAFNVELGVQNMVKWAKSLS